MTPESFVVLAASCAIAVLLVTELKVPLGSLRRWLLRGPHVETTDETYGPWYVVGEDGQRDPTPHLSPAEAADELPLRHRVRAWLADLLSCPWCSGAYCSAAALVGFSFHAGADVLWFWLPLWWAGSVMVVLVKALSD